MAVTSEKEIGFLSQRSNSCCELPGHKHDPGPPPEWKTKAPTSPEMIKIARERIRRDPKKSLRILTKELISSGARSISQNTILECVPSSCRKPARWMVVWRWLCFRSIRIAEAVFFGTLHRRLLHRRETLRLNYVSTVKVARFLFHCLKRMDSAVTCKLRNHLLGSSAESSKTAPAMMWESNVQPEFSKNQGRDNV